MQAKQPMALMESSVPLPMAIAAAGFLEKYGPDERYNYLNFLAAVPCPTLALFGGIDVANNMAFQQAPEEVRRVAEKKPHIAVEVVS